ncbi:hypothetical protein [Paracoccus sp. R86501]|uniref:hypothetical protein n=1 Tax=Paracoccus sp. R86501 TaxID=3101711 RepID=UPI00366C38F6
MAKPLGADLTDIAIPLSKLFLDPNNPRFVGSDWIFIPDHDAIKSGPQEEAAERLIASHDIDKLKSIMEHNGYLPIDRVVVRRIDDDHFIVLEGNRRICSAKQINGYLDTGEKIPDEIMKTFDQIPCLLYEGVESDKNAAWVFQGIRHISGISEWSAFNKAKLIVEQMEAQGLSFTEVGKSFGLSAFGAAQWVRGYYSFLQAKEETEFGKYIDERIYPFFQEVFGRSSIAVKEWMKWDDTKKLFLDAANLNEFVSWFYPKKNDDESDIDREPTKSDMEEAWSRRRISKRDDLRNISYMIHKSPKNWMEFRSGADVEKAYNRAILDELEEDRESDKNAVDKFFSVLTEAKKQLDNTPFSVIGNEDNKEKLREILDEIIKTKEKLSAFL